MSEEQATAVRAALDPSPSSTGQQTDPAARPGFLRRYRLPLLLAVVAACLYVGSILYIVYGRGQVG